MKKCGLNRQRQHSTVEKKMEVNLVGHYIRRFILKIHNIHKLILHIHKI